MISTQGGEAPAPAVTPAPTPAPALEGSGISPVAFQALQRAYEHQAKACIKCGTLPASIPCVFSPCGCVVCYVCSAQHTISEGARLPQYAIVAAEARIAGDPSVLDIRLSHNPIGTFAVRHADGSEKVEPSMWDRVIHAGSCPQCRGLVTAVVHLPIVDTRC